MLTDGRWAATISATCECVSGKSSVIPSGVTRPNRYASSHSVTSSRSSIRDSALIADCRLSRRARTIERCISAAWISGQRAVLIANRRSSSAMRALEATEAANADGHGQLMPRADPRADHVAGAEQFDVRAGVGDDPDDDQPVEQQRAEASRVGRRREPPGAALELEHRRQRRRDGERPLHLVDPAAQVGISLEHPYGPRSGVGVRPASLLEVGRRRQCRATRYLQLEACRGVLRQRHRRVKPVDLLQIRAHELSVERPTWARARPSPGSAASRRSSAAARRSGCRVSGAAWPAARRRR